MSHELRMPIKTSDVTPAARANIAPVWRRARATALANTVAYAAKGSIVYQI